MGRKARRDGVQARSKGLAEAISVEVGGDPQEVEDTLERVRRQATDTTELLIVHEGAEVHPTPRRAPSKRYIKALREQVDTGGYAVLPDAVAEAMVRRAEDLSEDEP